MLLHDGGGARPLGRSRNVLAGYRRDHTTLPYSALASGLRLSARIAALSLSEGEGFISIPRPRSDCVVCQAGCCQGRWSRKMALRMVSSLRIAAIRATFLGRPAAINRR